MAYAPIIIILTAFYFIVGIIFAHLLNDWIKGGKAGSKPYTRLTMLMMVISFVSVLLMATTVVMNGFLLENTKAALIA
ncbi:hypothetical protein COT48_04850 [Candidatus Woesearchaeota archaeon CG08_land_8_20_14_0_20_47_9]|nr:MAG: hypothetical protein AUJ69_01810 [Candidatus Woesearchaeota archaeon CG1_02_47_18]PIN72198.1 MAG: hypothetical protein COV22_03890 [Candidatus Woesearchaeota archaeon CG10_big_fil_rev_8_21_14_0_10_47_5]PIO03430.1 MAG: hypothetical protein COT48_04850 [Candidatus Woesearchaeota archaeon CG08_land_8_20_14_0_20_47_9]HII29752.1 hypothetical protein [Candidatus Woesearchaeota archaeon]